MNNSWLMRFFALSFLCATFPTRASMISIPKDIMGQGTQYRFQYFVRDESGDYKTQEEAGEGGSARGSYAVEEPDGDLRIVQYTADTEGGFKAHIKVDHGGKSPAKFQEINIPAAEMRRLVMSNRKKVEKIQPEVETSKSYALGPPARISDVVIEQAAAIREIISKEIEAEEKSEAQEKRNSQQDQQPDTAQTTFVAKRNVTQTNAKNEDSPLMGSASMNAGDIDPKIIDKKPENADSSATNVRSVNVQGIDATAESVKGFEITKKNMDVGQKMEKIDDLSKNQQSPVVRVISSPGSTDLSPTQKSTMDDEKNVPSSQSSSPKPVRNLNFKNQITFYRPSVNNLARATTEVAAKDVSELDIGKLPHSLDNDEKSNNNNEQIVLSFYEKDGEDGHFKSKNVSIPYEVLRPWLK